MNTENLEFLVYDLSRTNHGIIWTRPNNIWNTFSINYPEVSLGEVKAACESLYQRGLLEKDIDPEKGDFFRRSHVWYALGLPERDRYGNLKTA
jgi:hypothetical protein